MTRLRQPVARFRVVCDDYKSGPTHTDRESAERRLAAIEAAGHCRLPHSIIEVE
jgi:hypothetical protein